MLHPKFVHNVFLFLVFTVNTQVGLSVCPVGLSTFRAHGFSEQTLVLRCSRRKGRDSFWELCCFLVAYGFACGASINALVWIGNYCLPILKCEDAVWAVFYASWHSIRYATITFLGENRGVPSYIHISHYCSLLSFS
jgi:hypothetical protein